MSELPCRNRREEWAAQCGLPAGHEPGRPVAGKSDIQRDFNEQRLIYKCRLDPSTDNSGYAGVVRVIRNGGSAHMEDETLVIENASSGDAAHSHRMVRRLQRGQGGSSAAGGRTTFPPIIRPWWSGIARSSRRP